MEKLTLHEAIIKVLKDRGTPIGATEIAEIINKEGLYQRADEKPLQATQVCARVHSYPSLFRHKDRKICLVNRVEKEN